MHKFSVFLILLTVLLASCSSEEAKSDDEVLVGILDKVSKETGLPLSHEVSIDKDSVLTLNITIESPVEMMTDQTDVLITCFNELSEEAINFDMYLMHSHKGGIALGISIIDLEYISSRVGYVNEFMVNLKNRKKGSIMSFIQPGAFSGADINTLISRCSGRLQEFDYKYLGFELTQKNDVTYCKFIFESNDAIYRINYNLTSKDQAISNIEYPN